MRVIAYVEDNAETAEILSVLMQQGLPDSQLVLFESGAKLLDNFQPKAFDLILLDIGLPDMNGLEVLGRIRDVDPEIPVIALTGYAFEDDKEKAKETGFTEY